MPNFVGEQHRRNWMASQRRARKAKAKAPKRDAPTAGGKLGQIHPPKPAPKLSGEWDSVMSYLRISRVRANDEVTKIDNAIHALELCKPR